jgi:hypothetical protein
MKRSFLVDAARTGNDAQVAVPILGGLQMSDDAPRWASFSSAFSIVLSLASDRIAELGCAPIGDDPQAFVDGGGLRRLETEAADAAIRRVREAAYPLIFKLFGSEMPRGKERKLVLNRLGEDLARIEKTLGYRPRPVRDDASERRLGRLHRYQERKRLGTKAK